MHRRRSGSAGGLVVDVDLDEVRLGDPFTCDFRQRLAPRG